MMTQTSAGRYENINSLLKQTHVSQGSTRVRDLISDGINCTSISIKLIAVPAQTFFGAGTRRIPSVDERSQNVVKISARTNCR